MARPASWRIRKCLALNLLPLIDPSLVCALVDVGARGILLRRDGSPPILLELSHCANYQSNFIAMPLLGALGVEDYDALTQPR